MLEPDVKKRISLDSVSESAWLEMEDASDSDEDDKTDDKKSEKSKQSRKK